MGAALDNMVRIEELRAALIANGKAPLVHAIREEYYDRPMHEQVKRLEKELTAQYAEVQELTGGRVNYYLVQVLHPQREDQAPYQAECEDIIQALGLDFNEGCVFKALWRRANARQGNGKPDGKDLYDAEKIAHYAGRILKHAQQK